jgi:hypothetical protein
MGKRFIALLILNELVPFIFEVTAIFLRQQVLLKGEGKLVSQAAILAHKRVAVALALVAILGLVSLRLRGGIHIALEVRAELAIREVHRLLLVDAFKFIRHASLDFEVTKLLNLVLMLVKLSVLLAEVQVA